MNTISIFELNSALLNSIYSQGAKATEVGQTGQGDATVRLYKDENDNLFATVASGEVTLDSDLREYAANNEDDLAKLIGANA